MERRSPIDPNELVKRDAHCVWHPYTQALTSKSPIPIEKGKNEFLIGYDGTAYFDAISSWCVNIHGHCHPYIANKIAQQAHALEHLIFAGFTHSGAVELAERLLKLVNIPKGRVFFSDNGSTAVETALKIALQYWHNKDEKRTKIICFENAYHGDTFGAMSLAGKGSFNLPFQPFLFTIKTIPAPRLGKEECSLKQLHALLKNSDAACFIFEPILQAVGGMIVHSAEGLEAQIKLCHEYGVITIADEVLTGFGRTGPAFACDRLNAKPDIFCLSKGLTGGFLPLGATVCKEHLYQAFLSEQRIKALLHGHSYCGNPLACAAALANLDLFDLEECSKQRQRIQHSHQRFCTQWSGHPSLKRCEVLGTILILEYQDGQNSSYFSKIRDYLVDIFLHHNIIVRPFGNVLYLMPPYCTAQSSLDHAYECITLTLEENNEY